MSVSIHVQHTYRDTYECQRSVSEHEMITKKINKLGHYKLKLYSFFHWKYKD